MPTKLYKVQKQVKLMYGVRTVVITGEEIRICD